MPKFYEPSQHFLTSDGVRINFLDVKGDECTGNVNASEDNGCQTTTTQETKTILLVHGLMCSTKMWQPPYGPPKLIDSLLERGYRVVAPDCRGHGTSDKPNGCSSYGLRMVRDLVELLDHLKISRVYGLVGYSMGAELGIKFVTLHPTKVHSLCIGGSGWSHGTDWYNQKAYGSFVNPKTRMGCLCHTLRYVIWYPCCCCWIGPCINGDNVDMGAFFAVCEGMKDVLRVSKEELESLHVPILGISGEYDEEVEYLQRIEGVIPNYRLIVIPKKNHEAALGDPVYTQSVLDFLQDTAEAIQI